MERKNVNKRERRKEETGGFGFGVKEVNSSKVSSP
jgi:hypothetical protein